MPAICRDPDKKAGPLRRIAGVGVKIQGKSLLGVKLDDAWV